MQLIGKMKLNVDIECESINGNEFPLQYFITITIISVCIKSKLNDI